jgi:hypothetical protein
MYKIMAEGVVNSSKKIDDGTCNFSCYGQLLDLNFWVVCTSFTAKDFFSGGRSVVDFWKPMLSIVHGPEPKSRLGPVLFWARRASRCEPLLEKNLEQLELAKKIPKLKTRRNFEQKRMAKTFTKTFTFQSLGSLLGLPYGLPR